MKQQFLVYVQGVYFCISTYVTVVIWDQWRIDGLEKPTVVPSSRIVQPIPMSSCSVSLLRNLHGCLWDGAFHYLCCCCLLFVVFFLWFQMFSGWFRFGCRGCSIFPALFVIRTFGCFWYVFRFSHFWKTIPSLEKLGQSVVKNYYHISLYISKTKLTSV